MSYSIRHLPTLRKLLWLDTFLGDTTALAGLIFSNTVTSFLGFNPAFIIAVSVITLCYALVALYLSCQRVISIPLLRLLIAGNWTWAIISIGLACIHFEPATVYGKIFLVLQVIVVGGLAYFEGKQLISQKKQHTISSSKQ